MYRTGGSRKHILALAISFIIFVMSWSVIVLGKIYSLHSYVFDLGFIMQRLWQPFHILTLNFYLYVLFNSGFQFVLSPLYFFDSLPLLLLAQVFAIGVSCFPLFGIAKKLLNNNFSALVVSIGFLTYFPSSGILWFDVHIQAFFIPLFIFAYYFFVNERYGLASIFFILSGMVRYPYIIFPMLFSMFELSNWLVIETTETNDKRRMKFDILILAVSIFLLIGGMYFVDSVPTQLSHTTPSADTWNRLFPVFLTFLITLGPLLFLPVLKIKWLTMSLPFFVLGLGSNDPYFVYPYVLQVQYTSMIVPIAFIGTIEAISSNRILSADPNIKKSGRKLVQILAPYYRFRGILAQRKTIISALILSIILIGSIFYQPYSPLNSFTEVNYHFNKNVSFNTGNYDTLMALISLIPKTDPYVLYQNDMPEMLPRPAEAGLSIVFTSYLSSNITIQDVLDNTFPVISNVRDLPSDQFVKIDYLLAYTQSSQYYLEFAPGESTMYQILSLMITSGKYGILAEASGFILIKRDYQGVPKIYSPLILERHFNPTSPNGAMTFHDLSAPRGSSTFVTLVPGNYTVTYYISISNNSNLSIIHGGLGYNLGAEVSQTFNVPGSYFKKVNVETTVTFNVSVPNEETYTVFIISGTNFVGNLTVYKVQIAQTSF